MRSKFLALAGIVAVMIPGLASAQWSANSATPVTVVGQSGDQVQPKIRPTQDGGFYVSWFDNRTGGYDVYMQRFNVLGVAQWAADGVLVCDRGFSSTVDYDLTVCANGDALVIFNDDRSTVNQITVNRLDSAGNLVWGTSGSTVSTGTAFKANPHVAELTDGRIMTGWSESPSFKMQMIDSNGALLGATQTVTETGHQLSMCDMKASDNGSFIVLWYRTFTSSGLSSKWLYSQKYAGDYSTLWGSSPVTIYAPTGSPYGSQGGSIQNGYFPTFVSDGKGGAVYAWYENAGPRNALLQHVRPDGTLKFALHGVSNHGVDATRIRVGASLAYNRATGEYFVASPETNSGTQSVNSVFVQKFDSQGQRQWGDTGVTIIANNANQPSFVQCQLAGNGVVVCGFDSRSATTGVVFAAGVAQDGTALWGVASPFLVDSNVSTKGRLDSTDGYGGYSALAWQTAGSGVDVAANRLNFVGDLGNRTNKLTGSVTLSEFTATYNGQPVQIQLAQGGTVLETHYATLNTNGEFWIDTNLTGVTDVHLKGSHWLNQVQLADIQGDVSGFSFTLVNGDVNPDDEVNLADYAALAIAFGSTPNDANWLDAADLNGDCEVNLADYAILGRNFGLAGDE